MVLIIIAIVYMILPAPVQGLVLLLNIFIPDQYPCIDEIAMAIGILAKCL